MEFLGIGPMELVFILIIALVLLGPKDMVKAGRTLGKFMRDLVKSDTWKVVKTTTRELENLPNRLMREAGLEEELRELKNFPHNTLTAADLTRSIKPPTPPSAGGGGPPASPEDAAFIPDPPVERDDHPESMPPPSPPDA